MDERMKQLEEIVNRQRLIDVERMRGENADYWQAHAAALLWVLQQIRKVSGEPDPVFRCFWPSETDEVP